mgnify:CR=1 FL=1
MRGEEVTETARTILQALRGAAPTSIVRLSKLTSIDRERVYRAVLELRNANLVVRKARATYDVTRRGSRFAAGEFAQANLFSRSAVTV